ncbi:MAG: patatin-like phospholipase family protein, partial [Sphaerochaetaceae bacterium]|nr:patatin-like phospholipase family protein [Sphaerochaetaceae bacterium]
AHAPVFVVSYELLTGHEFLISSYSTPNWTVKDAGRATSAAPTYFPPLRKDGQIFIDGGVIANNPSVFAYAEARRLYPDCKRFNILSIGTAGRRHRMQPDAGSGLLDWVDQLLPMYQSSQKRASDFIMDELPDVRYVRIDGYMTENMKMDDTSEKSLCSLRELGKRLSDVYDDELQWFASKIASRMQNS